MIYPKFLQKGSTIGVPAPSSGAYDQIHINRQENAKKKLEEMGYKVKFSKNIMISEKGRSASAEIRGKEINEMFENDDIDFIICAAGGEFLVETLPYINFEKIAQTPKYIQGFSDPTGILFPLTTKYDISTIYACNSSSYGAEEYFTDIKDNLQIITGNLIEQRSYEKYDLGETEKITGLEAYNLTEPDIWKILDNQPVQIKGRVIAGCFDIIAELAGTKYDGMKQFNEKYKEDGIIFIFDNCELSKEELIRVLWKFNELEYFKYAKGIVFGRNGEEKSLLGYTMEEALKDSVISKLGVPIIYDADISHKDPSMTIINGSIATINVEEGKGKIKFELK